MSVTKKKVSKKPVGSITLIDKLLKVAQLDQLITICSDYRAYNSLAGLEEEREKLLEEILEEDSKVKQPTI